MATRLHNQGWTIASIIARNGETGKALANQVKSSYSEDIKTIDVRVNVILLAVGDDDIAGVSRALPSSKALVLHCSGSTPLSALAQKFRGVIWPLRSIAQGQKLSWSDLNIVIEADTDIAQVRCLDLIDALGAKAVQMNSKERQRAHLVAVILNNFSNHLLHMADILCAEQGMDRRIFQDLMAHTLDYKGPALESQTGPAARGDQKTITKQLKALKNHPEFAAVYESITNSIQAAQDDSEL